MAKLSCEVGEIAIEIASFPGTIERLVALLAEDVSPDVQARKKKLWHICLKAVENVTKDKSFPGGVEGLVALLANGVSSDVQRNVAVAISNISTDVESRVKIAAFPGAVQRLDELLAEDITSEITRDELQWKVLGIALNHL